MAGELRPAAEGEIMVGRGELAARMRALDWAATPIGPSAAWPASLRTAVSICLESRFPILLWWGPRLVMLYNDAYRPMLGATKHPAALGQPGETVWPEIWPIIGPMLHGVLERAEATWSEDQLLILDRNGYLEECYFTFSYSPIRDESGGVGGVFTAVTEVTDKVVGTRRVRTLREIASRTADARRLDDACARAIEAIAENPISLPFVLLYLFDDTGRAALCAQTGLPAGHPAAAPWADPPAPAPAGPVGALRRRAEPVLVPDLTGRFGAGLGEIWGNAIEQALVLPIVRGGQAEPAGALVVGLNPCRALDDAYRGFLELVARQVGTALDSALAYEAEVQRAEALAELDRAKTAFFSNISHEFRTPLTLMLGPLDDALADRRHPLDEAQQERLTIARRNGGRLLRLVNTLLDFARLEAGRVDAAFVPTDLATLTAELASGFRSAMAKAGLRYTVDCPPLPEPIYADPELWEKIVLNLISNAFKFTLAGEVAVTLRWTGDGAELAVRDTGHGIPPEELPRLFERFHRIRGGQARTHEGTGIGLALVHELVKLHGGTIAVDSRVGQGSTFAVRLPAGRPHLPADQLGGEPRLAPTWTGAAAFGDEALRWLPATPPPTPLESEAAAPSAAATAPAGRVLVVDDNADMRDYLRRLLAGRFAVDLAPDGAAGLAQARARPPDLILSDMMMPGLDGAELLRALRQNPGTSAIPVILLSARAGEEAVLEGLAAGADDYLVKPFSARELIARVQTHVELARLRQAAIQARNAFLATISHDLKTPLTTIRGLAQGIERRSRREDRLAAAWVGDRAGRISAETVRMVGLIDELLDVAQLEHGERLDLNRAPTDLVALARHAVATCQERADRHRLHLDAGSATLVGDWDGARLERVLDNLIDNAVKYSPAGGDVTVRLRQAGAPGEPVWTVCTVEDAGVGIPADDLEHIFDRFYRAGNVAGRFTGSGLGLAGAKQIVEQHGGTIAVASTEGRGTTVTVRLPLA